MSSRFLYFSSFLLLVIAGALFGCKQYPKASTETEYLTVFYYFEADAKAELASFDAATFPGLTLEKRFQVNGSSSAFGKYDLTDSPDRILVFSSKNPVGALKFMEASKPIPGLRSQVVLSGKLSDSYPEVKEEGMVNFVALVSYEEGGREVFADFLTKVRPVWSRFGIGEEKIIELNSKRTLLGEDTLPEVDVLRIQYGLDLSELRNYIADPEYLAIKDLRRQALKTHHFWILKQLN